MIIHRLCLLLLAEDTMMALPNNIVVRILESLYADFLETDECIDFSEHHCSLLHPCIPISKSASFKSIHAFRLTSSQWNKVFLCTARLGRYASHRIVEGPQLPHAYQSQTFIYRLFRKSVVLRRYRIFHNLDTEHGKSLFDPFSFSSFN